MTPTHALSANRFRAEGPSSILPVVQALADTLKEAGLVAEVVSRFEEEPSIGHHVDGYDITLWLSPSANPAFIRATSAGASRADSIE